MKMINEKNFKLKIFLTLNNKLFDNIFVLILVFYIQHLRTHLHDEWMNKK